MYITVVRDEKIRKKLRLENGQLVKEPAANLAEYMALVVLATLEMIFYAVTSSSCTIITGFISGVINMQEIRLLSKERFSQLYPEAIAPFYIGAQLVATKTKDIFVQSSVFLFDFDVNKFTPEKWRNLTPAEYINLLSSVFSGFTGVGYVFNYGSSAGIFTALGIELKPAWGFHFYIKAKNALDIERFITVLYAKLILAEIYWKNDAGKIYTLIDRVAASRERFCFEVCPLLCDGLVRNVPDPQHIQGCELDTEQLADLTEAELEQLASIMGVKANALAGSDSKQLMRLSKHDNKMLHPDTIVTLANNTQTTPKDFYASAKSHESCYATFRNDIQR